MQTIKTAAVVVLLLFVIYGGFVAINGSNNNLSPELEGLVDLSTDTPDITGVTGPFTPAAPTPGAASSSDPWAAFNSAPNAGFGASATSSPSPLAASAASNSAFPAPPSPLPNIPSLPAANTLPPLPNAGPTAEKEGLPAAALLASTNAEPKPSSVPDFGIALPTPKPLDSIDSKTESTPFSLPPTLGANSSSDASSTPPTKDNASEIGLSEGGENSKPSNGPSQSYENAKENALAQAKKGQLREALATLSMFYNAHELTPDQRQDLLDLLDALAREVVYSRQHFLDIAYTPVPGETIEQVAKKFDVPSDILAKINAVGSSGIIPQGTKLKVVPGPFRAEVDLTRSEITLFIGELYASRYPVSIGSDPAPKVGEFKVIDKQRDRSYYGEGAPIPGTDPRNPYGGYWIDLGEDLCIHGASDSAPGKLGCISLSPQDASDVFGMLGPGASVSIRN